MIIQQHFSFPSVNEVFQSTEPFSKSPIPLLTTTIGFLYPFYSKSSCSLDSLEKNSTLHHF